jgi:MraZ protein
MFLGQFDHAVDAKGRVAVPASFRPGLAAGAVVTIGLEGRLMIWPDNAFSDHRRALTLTAGTPAEQRMFLRWINANTVPLELDAQGRLLLNPRHRDFAQIGDRATFIGMGEWIDLCATGRWQEDAEKFTPELFTELADRVSPRGFVPHPSAPS